ncbi:MAG TPA: methyltransferase [Burkholderiales bacterium]|nr:methyltransferase [Burkholderiales bacterium]
MARDSSKPDFWETRYREHVTPWDAGKVPASLQAFASGLPRGVRILIPGCGSAYEAAWLADAGFDVLAIDFSPAAVEAACRTLGKRSGIVREADFFTFDPGRKFDVVYERAFLCALPRRMWPGYAPRCAQLLAPGGVIAGFWFFADTPKGPPFGTSDAELGTLMSPLFARIGDEPVADSIEVFRGRERWQVWRRASDPAA